MSSLRRVTGLTLGLLAVAVPLAAQGWIEPQRIPAPRRGIEKVRASVQVTIQGRVARVVVEEWFKNTNAMVDEGVYHYPLPGEAVFNQYSLWQGDTELRGEMMDAQQARTIYENIVRQLDHIWDSDRSTDALDHRRGVLLSSNYDYPGRYTRWDLGFTAPPLELSARGRASGRRRERAARARRTRHADSLTADQVAEPIADRERDQ